MSLREGDAHFTPPPRSLTSQSKQSYAQDRSRAHRDTLLSDGRRCRLTDSQDVARDGRVDSGYQQ